MAVLLATEKKKYHYIVGMGTDGTKIQAGSCLVGSLGVWLDKSHVWLQAPLSFLPWLGSS